MIAGMGGSIWVTDGPKDPESMDAASGRTLDVTQWVGQRIGIEVECPHSGSLGAITRRRVAYDYSIQLEVAYDVSNPPEYLLSTVTSVAFQLLVGDPSTYVSADMVQRYVSPSGLLTVAQTIVPSKGTDVVRQLCTIKGNSLMFLLPDERVMYNIYIGLLRTNGQVT